MFLKFKKRDKKMTNLENSYFYKLDKKRIEKIEEIETMLTEIKIILSLEYIKESLFEIMTNEVLTLSAELHKIKSEY